MGTIVVTFLFAVFSVSVFADREELHSDENGVLRRLEGRGNTDLIGRIKFLDEKLKKKFDPSVRAKLMELVEEFINAGNGQEGSDQEIPLRMPAKAPNEAVATDEEGLPCGPSPDWGIRTSGKTENFAGHKVCRPSCGNLGGDTCENTREIKLCKIGPAYTWNVYDCVTCCTRTQDSLLDKPKVPQTILDRSKEAELLSANLSKSPKDKVMLIRSGRIVTLVYLAKEKTGKYSDGWSKIFYFDDADRNKVLSAATDSGKNVLDLGAKEIKLGDISIFAEWAAAAYPQKNPASTPKIAEAMKRMID